MLRYGKVVPEWQEISLDDIINLIQQSDLELQDTGWNKKKIKTKKPTSKTKESWEIIKSD